MCFLQPSISNVEDEGIVDEIKKLEEAICKEVSFSSNTIILIDYGFLVCLAGLFKYFMWILTSHKQPL